MFSELGGGRDPEAKTLYVYLLTSSILYKKTAYFFFLGGGNDAFARTIYYWVGNRPLPPPHMIDAPGLLSASHIMFEDFIMIN